MKRQQCRICSFWKTSTGVFLKYDQPGCHTKTVINEETGEAILVREPPTLDIKSYTEPIETRSWCDFPFDSCKFDSSGAEYVVCDGCPCVYDGRCSISGTSIQRYNGDEIVMEKNCPLVMVEMKDGANSFIPPKKKFPMLNLGATS